MNIVKVTFTVPQETLFMFTTLLQSGVEIICPDDKALAHFLSELPSFTEE